MCSVQRLPGPCYTNTILFIEKQQAGKLLLIEGRKKKTCAFAADHAIKKWCVSCGNVSEFCQRRISMMHATELRNIDEQKG